MEPIKQTKRNKRRVVVTAEVIRHDGESSKNSSVFGGAQAASLLRPAACRPKCSKCFRQAAENCRLTACAPRTIRSPRQDSRHAELHSDAPAQFSLRTPGRNRLASTNLP